VTGGGKRARCREGGFKCGSVALTIFTLKNERFCGTDRQVAQIIVYVPGAVHRAFAIGKGVARMWHGRIAECDGRREMRAVGREGGFECDA
jgi:hypothetical protein